MKRFPLSVLPLVAAASLASAQSFEVAKIPADSAKGFQWPYYLCVPATVKQPAVLLVQPNASLGPSDDFSTHDVTAYGQAFHTQTDQGFAALGSPSLVPVFPRPRDLYTQSLDRDTLLTQRSGYQRLDLQLIAMVEDARARLAARGIVADQKFWMRGFSAAGAFASRFSLLHPELVKAVSVGGAGLGPALPVASWKGKTLYYPLGVADLETLTGKKFDLGSFRQIAFQFYVGDADTASTGAAFQPGTNPEDALLAELFGSPNIPLSFMRFEEVYTSVTTLSQFLVFPGVGHEEQPSSFDIAFFERNRGTPAAPPPKPMLYATQIADVVCGAAGGTTLSLVNSSGNAAHCEVEVFSSGLRTPVQTLSMPFAGAGRTELDLCSAVAGSPSPSWVKIKADSGFVSARARYRSPAGEAGGVTAASGLLSGLLAPIGDATANVIGLVNGADSPVVVRLYAHDSSGKELAQTILEIGAASRMSGPLESFFGKPLPAATHVRFEARSKIAAFLAAMAADGTPVEILPAFRHYDR